MLHPILLLEAVERTNGIQTLLQTYLEEFRNAVDFFEFTFMRDCLLLPVLMKTSRNPTATLIATAT